MNRIFDMTELENVLKAIPYSISISKLESCDKMDSNVDDYMLELKTYIGGGMWKQMKTFFGNDLLSLAKEAFEWSNNYLTKKHF